MYFYKDINGLFHVGTDILPAGKYILRKYNNDTIVSIESADTHALTMDPIEITNLQKENDSYYTDLADFLTDVGDFFI